jgi:hypothetical protein
MGPSSFDKYINQNLLLPEHTFDAVTRPVLLYNNEAQNLTTSWWGVTQPFVMESETFWHDFDQYLYFAGGDATNMDSLGGEVEFYLGKEAGKLEKCVITRPTMIYVKPGMLHCPLKFVRVDNPAKPILFQDISLAGVYRRFRPGSTQPLNAQNQPITL